MKRREFLKSSLAAAGMAGVTTLLGATADKPARELYELRLYHLRRGPRQKLFVVSNISNLLLRPTAYSQI